MRKLDVTRTIAYNFLQNYEILLVPGLLGPKFRGPELGVPLYSETYSSAPSRDRYSVQKFVIFQVQKWNLN